MQELMQEQHDADSAISLFTPSNLENALHNIAEMTVVSYKIGNREGIIVDFSDIEKYRRSVDFINLHPFDLSPVELASAMRKMLVSMETIEKRYVQQEIMNLFFMRAYPNGVYSIH